MRMSISDNPPCEKSQYGNIHDGIAQRKENSSGERFREEIGQVVSRVDYGIKLQLFTQYHIGSFSRMGEACNASLI